MHWRQLPTLNPAVPVQELTGGAVHPAVGTIKHTEQTRPPLLSNKYAHLAVQFRRDLTPTPEATHEKEEPPTAMEDAAEALIQMTAAAEEEVLDVAPLEPQTGDDWLHMAVLAQWQRMREMQSAA